MSTSKNPSPVKICPICETLPVPKRQQVCGANCRRIKVLKARADRRTDAKKMGLCINCCHQPATEGTRCSSCQNSYIQSAKRVATNKEYRERKLARRKLLTDFRRILDLCYSCSSDVPLDPGRIRCPACLLKARLGNQKKDDSPGYPNVITRARRIKLNIRRFKTRLKVVASDDYRSVTTTPSPDSKGEYTVVKVEYKDSSRKKGWVSYIPMDDQARSDNYDTLERFATHRLKAMEPADA